MGDHTSDALRYLMRAIEQDMYYGQTNKHRLFLMFLHKLAIKSANAHIKFDTSRLDFSMKNTISKCVIKSNSE